MACSLLQMQRTIEKVERTFIKESLAAVSKDLQARQRVNCIVSWNSWQADLFDRLKSWKETVKEKSLAQLSELNRDPNKNIAAFVSFFV